MEFVRETTSDLITKNALLYPNDTAYIFDDRAYSWTETKHITDRLVLKLLELGVEKGSHIGFWSLNTIQLVFHLLAAMEIGAVPAVVNWSYRAFEMKNVLRKADIQYMFLGEPKRGADYKAMVESVRQELPKLKAVCDIGGNVTLVERDLRDRPHLSAEEQEKLSVCKKLVDPEDAASITFTSGTTKVPKPVVVSHRNLICQAYLSTERQKITHQDIMMAPLPMFHSSGLSGTVFFALLHGTPTIIHRMFDAERVLRDIEKYRVTSLLAVPSMLELLVRCENFKKYDLSSLRVGLTSGAVISPDKLREVIRALGVKHFLMAYGQTECSPLITTTLYDDDLITVTETVGKPLPTLDVRVWDLKNDRELPTGETGEIQVRGCITMKGYYNYEEETKKKFTPDGWLKTTDAGYFDENGYLHFVARISDMIIRHGENISPAEIECVIEKFKPDILAVKVVGVHADLVQEEIAAFVQTRASKIVPEELKSFVKEYLASYKVPKYVFQLEQFPITATGKIDQGALKKMAAELTVGPDQ